LRAQHNYAVRKPDAYKLDSLHGTVVARVRIPCDLSGFHPEFSAGFAAHVPTSYHWWLFALSLATVQAAFLRISHRGLKSGATPEDRMR
jgi:hypothetical protein